MDSGSKLCVCVSLAGKESSTHFSFPQPFTHHCSHRIRPTFIVSLLSIPHIEAALDTSPRMSPPELHPEIWARVLSFLYRPLPPVKSPSTWEELYQADLCTVMRVNTVRHLEFAHTRALRLMIHGQMFHNAAGMTLYDTVTIDQLVPFFGPRRKGPVAMTDEIRASEPNRRPVFSTTPLSWRRPRRFQRHSPHPVLVGFRRGPVRRPKLSSLRLAELSESLCTE